MVSCPVTAACPVIVCPVAVSCHVAVSCPGDSHLSCGWSAVPWIVSCPVTVICPVTVYLSRDGLDSQLSRDGLSVP